MTTGLLNTSRQMGQDNNRSISSKFLAGVPAINRKASIIKKPKIFHFKQKTILLCVQRFSNYKKITQAEYIMLLSSKFPVL